MAAHNNPTDKQPHKQNKTADKQNHKQNKTTDKQPTDKQNHQRVTKSRPKADHRQTTHQKAAP